MTQEGKNWHHGIIFMKQIALKFQNAKFALGAIQVIRDTLGSLHTY